jgi:hypothetical protein
LDDLYRGVAWQLLGVGQRHLALLTSRVRFKLSPCPRSAAELIEVAIAAGPEAQEAAVDLVLGKGMVRPPDAEDDDLLRIDDRAAGTAAGGRGAALLRENLREFPPTVRARLAAMGAAVVQDLERMAQVMS